MCLIPLKLQTKETRNEENFALFKKVKLPKYISIRRYHYKGSEIRIFTKLLNSVFRHHFVPLSLSMVMVQRNDLICP